MATLVLQWQGWIVKPATQNIYCLGALEKKFADPCSSSYLGWAYVDSSCILKSFLIAFDAWKTAWMDGYKILSWYFLSLSF